MDFTDHLRSLEEALLAPGTRHDEATLTSLLAPDFLEFGSSGRVYRRDEIIADLLLERSTSTLTLVDFKLIASNADWALVAYRINRLDASGRIQSASLRSSTWIDRGNRWQILFHQGTPLPLERQGP